MGLGQRLDPFRDATARLTTVPGVSTLSAAVIVAEIGVDDMSRFPTAAPLVSWAGLCPRHDERAGKRRSTKLRKGVPWLKTLLVQTAWCAANVKGTYLRARFGRLKTRCGLSEATIAVAASILNHGILDIPARRRIRRPWCRPLRPNRTDPPRRSSRPQYR